MDDTSSDNQLGRNGATRRNVRRPPGIEPVTVEYSGPEAKSIVSRSLSRWQAALHRAKSLKNFPECSFNLKGLLARIPSMPDKMPSDGNWIKGFSTWDNVDPDISCSLRSIKEPTHAIWVRKRCYTTCIISSSSSFRVWEDKPNNGIALLVLGWSYVLSASLAERRGLDMEYAPISPPSKTSGLTRLDLGYASQKEHAWWGAIVGNGVGWSISGGQIAPWAVSVSDIGVRIGGDVHPRTRHPPTAREAACYLSRFCHAFDLGNQCSAALAAALSIPLHDCMSPLRPSTIELPKPCFRFSAAISPKARRKVPDEFSSIGYYMTLSLCDWAFGSSLWSIFWEPGVPCNFAGAWVGPIPTVLDPIIQEDNLELLAKMLSFTKAAPLWLGLALCGKGAIMRTIVPALTHLRDYPYCRPNIDGAAWTGVSHSFMDVHRPGPFLRDGMVSRADVWRLRHDCSAEYLYDDFSHTPTYGWPPFGDMRAEDVELEIRDHLECSHQWKYKHWTWLSSRITDAGFLPDDDNDTHVRQLPEEAADWRGSSASRKLCKPHESMNLLEASEWATSSIFWWACYQVERGFGGTVVPWRVGPDEPIKSTRSVGRVNRGRIFKWLERLEAEEEEEDDEEVDEDDEEMDEDDDEDDEETDEE